MSRSPKKWEALFNGNDKHDLEAAAKLPGRVGAVSFLDSTEKIIVPQNKGRRPNGSTQGKTEDYIIETPLTQQQENFVAEYLRDLNAEQAVRRSGYITKDPRSQANVLMRHPTILFRIKTALQERSKRLKIDVDYVLKNLVEIAERCLHDTHPKMKYNKETRKMEIATDSFGNEVWEFDAPGATRALELIGKHLKMFTDKIEISTPYDNMELEELQRMAEAKKMQISLLKEQDYKVLTCGPVNQDRFDLLENSDPTEG
jgi:phage terminase small subunit